jgi:hypothetical protein
VILVWSAGCYGASSEQHVDMILQLYNELAVRVIAVSKSLM